MIYWVFAIAVLVAGYVFFLRPYLAHLSALQGVFALLDQKEAGIWAKVRVSFSGLKRTLFSRLVALAGTVVGLWDVALPYFAGQDPTQILPEKIRPYSPFILLGIGVAFEAISRISKTPVGEPNVEVVAKVADVSVTQAEAAKEAPAPEVK